MPKLKPASPQSTATRTQLDARLAELYSVSPRTIRLWRRKNAPLDEPDEMPDWMADLRKTGKGDSAEVREARMRKLSLQIEALEIDEKENAERFVEHRKLVPIIESTCEKLRHSLRELLIDEQPALLVGKSTCEVQIITTRQYRDFVAGMRAWSAIQRVADQDASGEATKEAGTPPQEPSKSKPGRVADPEMEALRLRKLNLENKRLERENLIQVGDLIPTEVSLGRMTEHFGSLRQTIKNLLVNEIPVMCPGRRQEAILELNRKSLQTLQRHIRTLLEKVLDRKEEATQPEP